MGSFGTLEWVGALDFSHHFLGIVRDLEGLLACACGCGIEVAGRADRRFVDPTHRKFAARRGEAFWQRFGQIRRTYRPPRRVTLS